MVNTLRNNSESSEVLNYNKDAYIVGDSLSVGMTHGVNVAKNAVRWWMETAWMLQQVRKDVQTLKNKKVMFLLGGTNDIWNSKTPDVVIRNLELIAKEGRAHGLKVVVGTIPPIDNNYAYVKNHAGKNVPTWDLMNQRINKVNAHIKSHFDYIDFHDLLEDPANPGHFKANMAGAAKWADGIHPYNGYRKMREAQIQKLAHLGETVPEQPKITARLSEIIPAMDINKTIADLKNSIIVFRSQISSVFADGKTMTPEQKQQMEQLIAEKEHTIQLLENIAKEIESVKQNINTKNRELTVYRREGQQSMELSAEMQNKISDLQKVVLELDESQRILMKEFWLVSQWMSINQFLDKRLINEMQSISETNFLKNSVSDRLRYVTIGNISAEKILSGEVKDIEINFTFNGRFNRQLYIQTTAGMILPDEVRSVEVQGVTYSRNQYSLKWEFFDANGKRLIIRDETRIHISRILSKDELDSTFVSKIDLSLYPTTEDRYLALESEKRNIPASVIISAFGDELSQVTDFSDKKAVLEELFTEIERKKWQYTLLTHQLPVDEWGKLTVGFLAYAFGDDNTRYQKIGHEFGYRDEDIRKANEWRETHSQPDYMGNLSVNKFSNMNIPSEEINRIRKIRKFQPGSQDTITLFRLAARAGNLPEEWSTNQNLHTILRRESNGRVGILNYTIKGISLNRFYQLANSSRSGNPIGAKSTASGLGQLLLSNVDKYYPSGRKGIGDPIEEAVGFMKYIEDRYGNPDVAKGIYGKKWYFIHGKTWRREYKWFREWY